MAEPVAPTTTGNLRGLRRGAHLAFRGVRYATPPIGDRRFTAPEPVLAWSGERDASTIGAAAPQDPLVPPPFRATHAESEDCLFLDLYTPALDDAARPVLFWIHGGGFSHGSGSQPSYDGGPLAERGDVVVVTINYRLGALGYLHLGAVGGDAWGAATNAGQLDQILALNWVRDNIAAFGGDPAKVTIFGQSAGSIAVHTLLAMPAARGLFSRAIAQSGTAAGLGDADRAAAFTAGYLDRLGVPDADPATLRSIPVADLLAAQGPRLNLAPFVDGDSLPHHPTTAVGDGAAAGVPLLIGTTRDEQKLYNPVDRPVLDDAGLRSTVGAHLPRRAVGRIDEVIATYRSSRQARGLGAGDHDVVDAVATASRFWMPAIRLAEDQRRHQPRTYLYRFDWESPARRGTLGACHGLEIPFVFGTVGRNGNERMSGTGPDADLLSTRMMDAWIAFARTGEPSHPGIGAWPAYDPADRATMVFAQDCGVEWAPFEEERILWESLTGRRPAGT